MLHKHINRDWKADQNLLMSVYPSLVKSRKGMIIIATYLLSSTNTIKIIVQRYCRREWVDQTWFMKNVIYEFFY